MVRKSKYTKELLEPIVRDSMSMATVLRHLGLKLTGGNYRNIKQHISHHGISLEHFTGGAWSRGKTAETDENVARITRKITVYTDDEVFSEKSVVKNREVRKRLLKTGRKYACAVETCILFNVENPEWNGRSLTLHLDHINGKKHDNRILNLRFICPNCHQQTTTWGNKNN